MQLPFLRRALLFGAAFLIFGATSAVAGSLDAAKLAEIPRQMQKFVDDGTISGAVTLVGYEGEIARVDAAGYSDLASQKPMKKDSLFWIASMTKPVTAAGILLLQEQGKLSIDDPVEKHLPEFRGQWLAQSRSSDSVTLVKPARSITLRDLLTHTSGLADAEPPRPDSTLGDMALLYSQRPLLFPPGSQWQYCNSGINTLGRVIEVASGEPYHVFLEKRFFKPLGMKDTTFYPSASQAARLAKSYQPDPSGKKLEETSIFFLRGAAVSSRNRLAAPAGGLFSTASDMFRFYKMMLAKGKWDGKQILSEASVAELTRTQTGELKTGFTPGMSFGLGFAVVKEPAGVTSMLAPGSFGHGGAYGTQSWADPSKDLILILMIQRARLPNADASPIRESFQKTAAEAVR